MDTETWPTPQPAPNSNLFSESFWKRAFAVLGHQLAATLAVYAVLIAIGIVFAILGAALGSGS